MHLVFSSLFQPVQPINFQINMFGWFCSKSIHLYGTPGKQVAGYVHQLYSCCRKNGTLTCTHYFLCDLWDWVVPSSVWTMLPDLSVTRVLWPPISGIFVNYTTNCFHKFYPVKEKPEPGTFLCFDAFLTLFSVEDVNPHPPSGEGLPLSTTTWCLSGKHRSAGCGADRETNTHVAGISCGKVFVDFAC